MYSQEWDLNGLEWVNNLFFSIHPFFKANVNRKFCSLGEALMRIPVFAEAINKCDAVLKPRGVNVLDIVTNKDKKAFDNILNSFVGIAAIQV